MKELCPGILYRQQCLAGKEGGIDLIEAMELTKQFIRTQKKGKKEEFFAVDHVSFTAVKGEILGVLGPNGAGKTTLLRMLGSLMEPTSGQVVITDKNHTQITEKETLKKYGLECYAISARKYKALWQVYGERTAFSVWGIVWIFKRRDRTED